MNLPLQRLAQVPARALFLLNVLFRNDEFPGFASNSIFSLAVSICRIHWLYALNHGGGKHV